jgi:hypothetical protein
MFLDFAIQPHMVASNLYSFNFTEMIHTLPF